MCSFGDCLRSKTRSVLFFGEIGVTLLVVKMMEKVSVRGTDNPRVDEKNASSAAKKGKLSINCNS